MLKAINARAALLSPVFQGLNYPAKTDGGEPETPFIPLLVTLKGSSVLERDCAVGARGGGALTGLLALAGAVRGYNARVHYPSCRVKMDD